ncbi:MAG: ABC transporter ATP-binding protein [Planctomycetaceae bacterium]
MAGGVMVPEEAPADRAAGAGTDLRLRDVVKTYGTGDVAVHALSGVDLEVDAGTFVVLLGPSGSGKTTLLNVTGAIESPTSGEILVAGEDIARLDAEGRTAYRRERVGFVFQFYNLIPTLTARENVSLIGELTGANEGGRVDESLADVGLAERADHFPGQLSGGEQQRVSIARALIKRPSLLLCDEPTGALDLETGRSVLALLRQVNRDRRCTVLLVTHNSAIAEMADRVVKLRSGEVVDDATHASPTPAEQLRW